MAQKRFKQMNGEFAHSFIDTEDTSISYICDNENDCKNIVDLLNAQHEENELLQKTLDDTVELLNKKIMDCPIYCNLMETNQQQKETIKRLQAEIERWEGYKNDWKI